MKRKEERLKITVFRVKLKSWEEGEALERELMEIIAYHRSGVGKYKYKHKNGQQLIFS